MNNINNIILEGNKLIAEFDHVIEWIAASEKSLKLSKGKYTGHYRVNAIRSKKLTGKVYSDLDEFIKESKYHLSYEWLMPIVQRIIGLGWQFQLNSYGVSNDAKFINGENYIQDVAWSTPLLATYNLVIDFIKFYNLNKLY